mgnify:FL=1
MLLKIVGSKIPRGTQINANKIDTPARVKATGYPNNNVVQINVSSRRGIISICHSIVDRNKSIV